jgi:hypothetical protein
VVVKNAVITNNLEVFYLTVSGDLLLVAVTLIWVCCWRTITLQLRHRDSNCFIVSLRMTVMSQRESIAFTCLELAY